MAGTSVATSRWAPGQQVKIITVTCVGDAANGSIPDCVTDPIDGYIMRVATIPGTPNPTNLYDVSLWDSDGASISGTLLNDRAAASAENWIADNPIYVSGKLTVKFANQAVNSAQLKVVIYVAK